MSLPARLPPPLREPGVRRAVLGWDLPMSDGADPVVDLGSEEAERVSHYAAVFGANAEDLDGVREWVGGEWPDDPPMLAEGFAVALMALRGQWPVAQLARSRAQIRTRAWSHVLAQAAKPVTRNGVPAVRDVQLHALQPAHVGFFRFDTLCLQAPLFGGTQGPEMAREVYVGVDAALLLPYDQERDLVALVEQFRIGPWRRGDRQPWCIEPIAGLVDAGEAPEDTARREAVEETGLVVERLEPIGRAYASPGYSTDYFHMFVAYCDLPEEDLHGRIGGLKCEAENIRVHVMPFSRALAMADSGEIDVAPLVLMLNWLARHRRG